MFNFKKFILLFSFVLLLYMPLVSLAQGQFGSNNQGVISGNQTSNNQTSSTTTSGQGIVIPENTGLPNGEVKSVLTRTLNWLLMIFIVIATISFVVTGLQFIFSFGGSTGSETQARKNFVYTIIAIFIVGGSLIILNVILKLLGNGGTSAGQNPGSQTPATNQTQTKTPAPAPIQTAPSQNEPVHPGTGSGLFL